ncbi:unnamed protein product [Sphagnum balticum]
MPTAISTMNITPNKTANCTHFSFGIYTRTTLNRTYRHGHTVVLANCATTAEEAEHGDHTAGCDEDYWRGEKVVAEHVHILTKFHLHHRAHDQQEDAGQLQHILIPIPSPKNFTHSPVFKTGDWVQEFVTITHPKDKVEQKEQIFDERHATADHFVTVNG